MRVWGRLVVVVVALPLLAVVRSAEAVPTPALPAFCELADTANRWQGLGVGPGTTDQWEDPANWSSGSIPSSSGEADVCIPSGGVPRVRAGEETHLTTLDVASGATLHVDSGGKVFLYGDQAAGQDSVVRSGGRLEVVSGTFGGVAKLHVVGTMVLENNGTGAATLLVRDCSYDPTPGPGYPGEEACTTPVTPVSGVTGLVEVADTGVLDVRGGGVNLGDQFRLVVRGLARVRSGAYLAADHGTRAELRPHLTAAPGTGTLRFEGDGGYLEGRIGADTGIASLSTLVNQGSIEKTAGTGRVLVSAAYSQPSPGRVAVTAGTLVLPTGTAIPARVAGGAAYGTGRCAVPDDPGCVESTDAGFPQSARFQVPGADSSGAGVVVRRLERRSSRADLGRPVEVHASGLAATRRRPAVIELRLDASILRGKRWNEVRIHRKSGRRPYRLVPSCTRAGAPPVGETACVDRRRRPGSSRNVSNGSGAPDVIMVVRATRTSRWVGR